MARDKTLDACKQFYAKGGYTQAPSRLDRVHEALYASQYYADGGEVEGYAGGGSAFRWVKNLLRQGTTAERDAIDEVTRHAKKTGNEMLIVGDPDARSSADILRARGNSNSAPFPVGYDDFMMNTARPFSAHSHPSGSVTPSQGDLNVWANALNRYAGLPEDAVGRQRMWIGGIQSPEDISFLPSMEGDRLGMSQKINDLYAKRSMVDESQKMRGNDLLSIFIDRNMPEIESLPSNQYYQARQSLGQGYLANRVSDRVPLYLDPQSKLVSGSDHTIGDTWPALIDFFNKRGYSPYADGGPVYTPPENMGKPSDLELGYASQFFADGGKVKGKR